jgi:hypothetical protein
MNRNPALKRWAILGDAMLGTERHYLRVAREDAVVSAPQPAGLAKLYRLFWYLSE